MFVDDLHVLANSLEGLTKIIEKLIHQATKESIILNLDKSALYLDKKQLLDLPLIMQQNSGVPHPQTSPH